MVDSNKQRAHGQTAATDVASGQSKEIDKPFEHEEEAPVLLTRAFQRMRTDWHAPDKETIDSVQGVVENQIFDRFADAFGIQFDIMSTVREPVIDKNTGEVLMNEDGFPKWKSRPDGSFYEDWSRIGSGQARDWIHQIATRQFNWRQLAADAWGEALFAKAVWEEAFATGFDTADGGRKTVEARTAYGNRIAAEHRYFAVFKSLYSRKADAVCNSMELLLQRLKDTNS